MRRNLLKLTILPLVALSSIGLTSCEVPFLNNNTAQTAVEYCTLELIIKTDDGVVNSSTTLNVEKGKVWNQITPSADGYEFNGWYFDSSFTTPVQSDYIPATGGKLYAKLVKIINENDSESNKENENTSNTDSNNTNNNDTLDELEKDQTELQAKLDEANQKIDKLNETIALLNTTITKNNSEINNLSSTISGQKQDITTLTNQVTALTNEKEALNRTIVELNSEIKELNIQVVSYQNAYNELNSKYSNLNSSYNVLYDDNQALNNKYSALQSKYNSLNSNYSAFQEEYEILERNYERLESEYNTLSRDYEKSQVQLTGYKGQLTALNRLPRSYYYYDATLILKSGNQTATSGEFEMSLLNSNVEKYLPSATYNDSIKWDNNALEIYPSGFKPNSYTSKFSNEDDNVGAYVIIKDLVDMVANEFVVDTNITQSNIGYMTVLFSDNTSLDIDFADWKSNPLYLNATYQNKTIRNVGFFFYNTSTVSTSSYISLGRLINN